MQTRVWQKYFSDNSTLKIFWRRMIWISFLNKATWNIDFNPKVINLKIGKLAKCWSKAVLKTEIRIWDLSDESWDMNQHKGAGE